MAYVSGDKIEASHFNDFVNQMNDLWGNGTGDRGYGQSEVSTVNVDDIVEEQEWSALQNIMTLTAQHQGTNTTIPNGSNFQVGNIIYSHNSSPEDFQNAIDVLDANRLTFDSSSVAIKSGTSVSRTSSWNDTLYHVISFSFGSSDTARHFFNAGGQIRIDVDYDGGDATAQDDDWRDILDNVQNDTPIIIGAYSTNSAQDNTYTSGYYDLSSSSTQIYTQSGSGTYSINDYTIYAAVTNSGETLQIEIQFNDYYKSTGTYTGEGSPSYYSATGSWEVDNVNLNIYSEIDYQIADGPVSISDPSISDTFLESSNP